MKNYIYSLVAVIALVSFSCEDITTPDLGRESQWLQFERAAYSVPENSPEPGQIAVLYAAETNDSDIQVSFTYTASQADGYIVEPANGIVTIPAGEFMGYITVTPINDNTASGDITIDFSIEGNTGFNLGIAGEGVYNTTSTLTIVEDDCPIDLSEWVGIYSVDEQFTSGVNAPFGLADFFGEIYQVELSVDTSDPSGTQVIINNSPGYNIYFYDGTVMSFLTCNQEVEFDNGNPVVADFVQYNFTSSAFNTESHTITCSGPLANYGPYEFILTKL